MSVRKTLTVCFWGILVLAFLLGLSGKFTGLGLLSLVRRDVRLGYDIHVGRLGPEQPGLTLFHLLDDLLQGLDLGLQVEFLVRPLGVLGSQSLL
jgi:hypothetical protein